MDKQIIFKDMVFKIARLNFFNRIKKRFIKIFIHSKIYQKIKYFLNFYFFKNSKKKLELNKFLQKYIIRFNTLLIQIQKNLIYELFIIKEIIIETR